MTVNVFLSLNILLTQSCLPAPISAFFVVTIILCSPSLAGEKLVNFLVEPKKGTKWPSKLPRFESRQDAIAVCKDMCKQQFIIRSEKQGKGVLAVSGYVCVSSFIFAHLKKTNAADSLSTVSCSL